MTIVTFLRHGQSEWNLANRFTGWVDVDLTDEGERQARRSGQLMKEAGIPVDRAYTSVLTRAVRTLWMALTEYGKVYVPIENDWRLNERHYGALTGLNKAETAEKHGEDQVKTWRRSYDTPPPPMGADDPDNPSNDPRYAKVPADQRPNTESLKMTLDRVMPYWRETIHPRIVAGENLVIAAHGNSIRAILKHIFQLNEDQVLALEAPTGNPLVVEFAEGAGQILSARYLDADRAQPIPALPSGVTV